MHWDDELIKVENLKSILDLFVPRLYHPDDPRYRMHWKELRKRCIEGVWAEQFGQWRYVPGRLGFFGVFGRFEDWREEDKTRIKTIPKVRDLEWHRAYYRLEMDGFSGWSEDDRFTSDFAVFEVSGRNRMHLSEKRYLQMFRKNGQFKEFVPPREAIFSLYKEQMGLPLYYNDAKNMTELGSRGGGKEMPDYQIVMTPTGEIPIGDIKEGDTVIGKDGKPTTVIGVFPQGEKDVYTFTLQDGRKVECGLDHQWSVYKLGKGDELITVTTRDILSKQYKYKHKRSGNTYVYKIPVNEPVYYPRKNLPIHPYILGALLGDGTLTTITPKIASSDQEIIDRFKELLPDYEIRYDNSTTNNHTIVYKGNDKYEGEECKYGCNPLHRKIKELGLNKKCYDKFIPEEYKYSSIEQRLDLVRGLMDTDGSISHDGYIEFTNTSEKLVDDLAYILRGLGAICTKGTDIRTGKNIYKNGEYSGTTNRCIYRLFVRTDLPVFFLKRKADRIKPLRTRKAVSIVDIALTGKHSSTCIMVDNEDKLFLTKDYIVTHNSYSEALMQILFDICFDGAKYYNFNEKSSLKTNAVVEVTSGGGGKSTELLDKVVYGMNALADPENVELGVWGSPKDDSFEPCPFYKRMSGDIKANNKENPWANEFSVKVGNEWRTYGSGSKVYNSVYTPNQRAGAQKSAGGRRTYVLHEECFGKDTLIRMYDLSLKKVQDLQVGDFVLGLDGKPKYIKSVTSGYSNLVKVIQKRGIDYITTENHPLYLEQRTKYKNWRPDSDGIHLQSYLDYKNKPSYYRRVTYGKFSGLIEFDHTDVVLDPYFLGLWLGDGNGSNQGVAVNTNNDSEIVKFLDSYANSLGLRLSLYEGKTIDYYSVAGDKGSPNIILNYLRNNNLLGKGAKHIPKDYLKNSYEVRMNLLAGIIDSDGYYNVNKTSHNYEVCISNNEVFRDNLVFLAKSLGFDVSWSTRTVKTKYHVNSTGIQYRVCIKGEIWKIPVRLERKKAEVKSLTNSLNSTPVKFEELGVGEYFGFSLDSDDKLCMLSDNTIVHNCGLNEVLTAAWGSNEGMLREGANAKMAGQKAIGTSGNMKTIQGAKKIFTHPSEFNCLTFKYRDRPDEEFGWFLAAWMVDGKFKDADGNTNAEAAKAYHREQYELAKKSLPEVFMEHRMNFPMEIEDMWVQGKGHYLPTAEAEERVKELMRNNQYESLGTPIELIWDSRAERGVTYRPDTKAIPFYEWPLEPERTSREAVFTMYIHPDKLRVNGIIPNDAIIATLDPYVAEEIEDGGSLGVSHFIVNPKYIPFGLPGNCLAATLIGKGNTTSHFHEILIKGLQFYGDPVQNLWYEADRGDKVRSDFLHARKGNMLCIRPQFEQGQYIYQRNATQTGYMVSGPLQKVTLLTGLGEWLLEETTLTINGQTETKRNIERFPCIFTLKQIQQYDIKRNFDAVSSLQAIPLAIGESKFKAMKTESGNNIFSGVNRKLKKYARTNL